MPYTSHQQRPSVIIPTVGDLRRFIPPDPLRRLFPLWRFLTFTPRGPALRPWPLFLSIRPRSRCHAVVVCALFSERDFSRNPIGWSLLSINCNPHRLPPRNKRRRVFPAQFRILPLDRGDLIELSAPGRRSDVARWHVVNSSPGPPKLASRRKADTFGDVFHIES